LLSGTGFFKIKIIGNDMKVFLILFALALLFVIGSAGAMRYLDNKRVTKKDNEDDKEGE
jgi:hypothetical protein